MAEMMTELAQIEQDYAKKIAALAGKKQKKTKKDDFRYLFAL
jgi:hypothetical protein